VQITAALVKTGNVLSAGKNILHLCEENDLVVLPQLDDLLDFDRPDFLVSVQYHQILKQQHIECAKELAVNLHMAPLPEYRGCNQFSFAIVDEAKTFGSTLHVMDEGIDSGDILFERRFPIAEKAWVQDLYDQTARESVLLFEEAIPKIISGNYERQAQEALIAERGTAIHYRNEINELKMIDKSWDAEKQDRHIRATWFPPFELPYYLVEGKKVYAKRPEVS